MILNCNAGWGSKRKAVVFTYSYTSGSQLEPFWSNYFNPVPWLWISANSEYRADTDGAEEEEDGEASNKEEEDLEDNKDK